MKHWLTLLASALALPCSAYSGEVRVAVAANFAAPMKRIASTFEAETGHKIVLSFGSTGKFYAQIKHGAPFDIFLAADHETPGRLEREGLGSSRYTYSVGRLALWSKQVGLIDDRGDVLKSAKIERLALADPTFAPYGAAAMKTLEKLGVLKALRPKLVLGENIGQTYQFVATGNASLGLVAMSQVYVDGKLKEGSAWLVPASLHDPIRQDAILLSSGKDKSAAVALMDYLRSDKARAVIVTHGYEF